MLLEGIQKTKIQKMCKYRISTACRTIVASYSPYASNGEENLSCFTAMIGVEGYFKNNAI